MTPTSTPGELLAQRLAAVPSKQLEALGRAVEGSMGYAATLMTWMQELLLWEATRRQSRIPTPTLPKLDALDMPTAVLTLSLLAAVFQSSADLGVDLRPTIALFDAIQEAPIAYAAGDGQPLQ